MKDSEISTGVALNVEQHRQLRRMLTVKPASNSALVLIFVGAIIGGYVFRAVGLSNTPALVMGGIAGLALGLLIDVVFLRVRLAKAIAILGRGHHDG